MNPLIKCPSAGYLGLVLTALVLATHDGWSGLCNKKKNRLVVLPLTKHAETDSFVHLLLEEHNGCEIRLGDLFCTNFFICPAFRDVIGFDQKRTSWKIVKVSSTEQLVFKREASSRGGIMNCCFPFVLCTFPQNANLKGFKAPRRHDWRSCEPAQSKGRPLPPIHLFFLN